VFSITCPPLTNESLVGEFLEVFEMIAERAPCYLPSDDWQRHHDFVQFLKEFSATEWQGGQFRAKLAMEFQVRDLERLLNEWVRSIAWMENAHPLAATFALETAEILSKHARGETHFGHPRGTPFRLEAIVMGKADRRRIADPGLKRDMTERTLNGLLISAKLPEGVHAMVEDNLVECPTGKRFFIIKRCHQSHGSEDRYHLEFQRELCRPFDLSNDFQFFGNAVVAIQEQMQEGRRDWWKFNPFFRETLQPGDRLATAFLPIRWITECRTHGNDAQPVSPLPSRWLSISGEISVEKNASQGLRLFDGAWAGIALAGWAPPVDRPQGRQCKIARRRGGNSPRPGISVGRLRARTDP
jgi:hypothetical protein